MKLFKLSTFSKFRILAAVIALLAMGGFLLPAGATTSITNTSIEVTILSTLTKALDLPGASVTSPTAYQAQSVFSSGTSNGQANIVWHDERTIAASSSETLDLNGSLTDALGGSVALTKIKALLVKAATGNTNNVVVGNAAANAWFAPFDAATDTVSIQPGGWLVLVAPNAGYTVTASTADQLKVANSSSGTSVTYDIYILGVE